MIESFKHRGLKHLYVRGDGSRVKPELLNRVETILARLDVALQVRDMDIHSLRLHPLKGALKGFGASPFRATGVSFFALRPAMLSTWT